MTYWRPQAGVCFKVLWIQPLPLVEMKSNLLAFLLFFIKCDLAICPQQWWSFCSWESRSSPGWACGPVLWGGLTRQMSPGKEQSPAPGASLFPGLLDSAAIPA